MFPVSSEILRCPCCRGWLDSEADRYICSDCDSKFEFKDGILDLLHPQLDSITYSEIQHYTEKSEHYVWMYETWKDSPFYRHYHTRLLEEFNSLKKGALILEIGCGLGKDGFHLLKSGYQLIETDVAFGELKEAKKFHESNGFGDSCAHILCDAMHLPFKSGIFDGVLMIATLHHLPFPREALKEVRRVLKKGGIFGLGTEPNNWQPKTIFPVGKLGLKLILRLMGRKMSSGEKVSEADKQTKGFSRRDLENLFRGAGFDSWELKPAGFFSAATHFVSQIIHEHLGKVVRPFRLEKLAVQVDVFLERLGLLKRFPWHWNAVAR